MLASGDATTGTREATRKSNLECVLAVTLIVMNFRFIAALCPLALAFSSVANAQQVPSPVIIGEPVRRSMTPAPALPVADSIAKNAVLAAGVDITNLSQTQAMAKLRAALEPKLKEPIRLVIGDYQYTYTRAELGATVDYASMWNAARKTGAAALRLDADKNKIVKELRLLDAQVKTDFEDKALNVGGSAVRVRLALEGQPKPFAEMLTVPFKSAPDPVVEDDKTEAPAAKVGTGRFPYLLADFSTSYNAGLRGRTTNLKMAASHINGTIVQPGQVFSANKAIGPRNAAAGWREAGMFVSGQVVSGTGAGICQASSTLYNATLLADLPIVERHAHSMRVTYVPPSQDAALLWGRKDFKFRNDTGGAIRVETTVSGGKFHAKLWGEKPGSKADVRVTSRVLSRAGGMRSEAYKTVGGKQVRLSRDYYLAHP